MKKITSAISIQQPYVELILLGKKKHELRKVRTNKQERVYLYASKTPSENKGAWKKVGMKPEELDTCKIVGSVQIVECLEKNAAGWYRYVLSDPRRLSRPKIAKNHPNPVFWKPKF